MSFWMPQGSSFRIKVGVLILCVGSARPFLAQTSASYDASEYLLNQGGHPGDGITLGSTSYRMSLDSVGDGLGAPALSSLSYRMAAGFVPAYPPPGEVMRVRFLVDHSTMRWDPERSTGAYNVYRGAISQLPGPYGACRLSGVVSETAVLSETPAPAGGGYFYLVTARNSLGEEGTKGFSSAGSERGNPSPCP